MNIQRIKENELRVLRKLALIQRQLGNVNSALFHLMRGVDGSGTKDEKVFKAMECQLKTDIADMDKQMRVLSAYLGFKVSEIEHLGDKRYEEAKDNFRKNKNLHLWV